VLADLKSQGVTVTTPDLGAFRANADRVYAGAEAQWDSAVLKAIRNLAS